MILVYDLASSPDSFPPFGEPGGLVKRWGRRCSLITGTKKGCALYGSVLVTFTSLHTEVGQVLSLMVSRAASEQQDAT